MSLNMFPTEFQVLNNGKTFFSQIDFAKFSTLWGGIHKMDS